ncbi:LAS superfamily LD-carboxypeptidase LdcB [Actinoplanes octamycinicus]|uniref:LAS superfamily LD-carboxypeptidase LdcB n=1 Tax=Actinoplanes octamycinicus TaxID=135948 RepID=A0A7W7GWI6_9ACTN|nr:M15 family metallopeptidase [Actinoplanes octamycinicus]MBB4739616.1 LAS superfamily LD-carboxypeptidase LdcB [Actinoplanes octamycinicus]
MNSRIADIQSRILALQTQQATTSTATRTAGSASASSSTFASHLQGALAAQGTPAADKAYKLNGKGIPEDLAAYGNGKIPADALEQVGGTRHKLWAPAAEKLTQLIADAKADGVKIGITDSYRPYTEQVDLARRKGLYSQGGLAAKPGTSEHGWGMATDLDLNADALAWMRKNGGRYGFVENVRRESWHWAFRPNSL